MRRDITNSIVGQGSAGRLLGTAGLQPLAGVGRRAIAVLLAAEMLAAGGLLVDNLVSSRTAGAASVPTSVPVASARSESPGTRPVSGLAPRSPSPGGGPVAAAQPVVGSVSAPSGPVSCDTDLPLSASPASSYNFLCRQGGIPVTWPKGRLSLYVAGLSAVQSDAFDQAVTLWAAAGRFQVSYTSSSQAADVTVTDSPLDDGQPGFVEDGYTTVSYRCTPVCSYTGAHVQLSSTANLSQSGWVSTILHELGHVAGLNHVSLPGEVMYPYLTAIPPQSYTAGDLQGLLILAAERGA